MAVISRSQSIAPERSGSLSHCHQSRMGTEADNLNPTQTLLASNKNVEIFYKADRFHIYLTTLLHCMFYVASNSRIIVFYRDQAIQITLRNSKYTYFPS